MELTELQEIIDRHGRGLKNQVGLALSEQEAKDIIKYAVSEVFSLHVVGSGLISEEEFNVMANDYIKLECNKNEEFNIKAQRFQDYRNGLKNMHKVLK